MIMKKQSQIASTSNIVNKGESAENTFKYIRSLVKQIYSNQSDSLPTPLKQGLGQKKISSPTNTEVMAAAQKTSKIKKNKRKNKKKSTNGQNDSAGLEKKYSQQVCGCCSGKIETPTEDGYESQDQFNCDSHVQTLIQTIGLELLVCYYDEIDKTITQIGSLTKENQPQQSKVFLKIMKKLSLLFKDYIQNFKQETKKQLQGQGFDPIETGFSLCELFKSYMIERFPLFKDFIQNFNLTQLDKQQNDEFTKLYHRNPLINSLYLHMRQITSRREKKKNKRQQQKLNKKSQGRSKKEEESVSEQEISDQNEIIERLQNMRIKQKQRGSCYFDIEEFEKKFIHDHLNI